MSADPAYDGYFADPFLLRTSDGYVAYGSPEPFRGDSASFEALVSTDLRSWNSIGTVFIGDPAVGSDCWAPEVVEADGGWWMYYSAGFGIAGHHVRVARADSPLGPFVDQGVNLTPEETFAIDASPFLDADGTRYLYFARDVLDAERPGTHLAVRRMVSMTELAPETVSVLTPNALWQRYEADREMYGRRGDWYTLEGPTVVRRDDSYVLFYSGGSWEGPDYGVSFASAASALGPWTHASADLPLVLSRALTGQRGPGHNSVLVLEDGTAVIAYHAWDEAGARRQLHIAPLNWHASTPSVMA
ncbi:glycoside hydrolase family 43 protein [Amnibacterium soli]|jgi:beta-xylosidase|uniref:Glycoside hydrolase family 43 protein n=1 Tax=Amnibacterium soli TaxID=1282736 RepID=A0ABP8ZB36_9MICO